MKDILITCLLTYVPGILLWVVPTVVKGLGRTHAENAPFFPDLGMDAHVAAVALLISVASLSTQPTPIFGNDLVFVHFMLIIVVTVILSITAILHSQGRSRWCTRIGIGSFGLALVWNYFMIFYLTV